MGIIADALAIALGGLLGTKLQNRNGDRNDTILGISVIILSLVGFLENVCRVDGETIAGENLMVVLFAFFIGSQIGEKLQIEQKLSHASNSANAQANAFVDAALFFGVGGLQISGPILLALNNDSYQLVIKAFLDLPFAIAFGAAYGKVVSLSALPVAAVQVLIAVIAYFLSDFFSTEMITGLCAMGYIILFFSGFNLVTNGKYKINNINMLPGILLVIVFNLIISVMERI